jgi:L-ascorbate metabolism protein UlaG (beta-lactamase superfamily)
MNSDPLSLTYIGGPTVLIEWGGLRLLTDPTFDPAGEVYTLPSYTLRKMQNPAIAAATLGRIDVVLLSHDHHFDNLDRAGRGVAERARRVVTTVAGAERFGGNATGLAPWNDTEVNAPGGRTLRITATPARHGPPDGDRGPVIGFVLAFTDRPADAMYVSGDTVWYEGVRAVSERFTPRVVVLFAGAAMVAAAGPHPLTFTGAGAVEAANAFRGATVVPLHFEGWEHFSESRRDVEKAFDDAGMRSRLLWLSPGVPTAV